MERRRTPRLFLRQAVFITEGHRGSSGTLLNVSEGGCAVESNHSLRWNDRVTLHVVLSDLEPPVRVDEARVCWATDNRFGVEFLVLSDEARHRLSHFLRTRFEPGL